MALSIISCFEGEFQPKKNLKCAGKATENLERNNFQMYWKKNREFREKYFQMQRKRNGELEK